MKFEYYIDFFDSLKVNGNFNRLGKLFRTKENGYIYDLGTSKVLCCSEEEYKVLECIFENNGLHSLHKLQIKEENLLNCLNRLKDVIESENLLKAPPLTEFSSLHARFDSIKDRIENNLEQITLELTEKCNLRCRYCIYTEENKNHRDFDSHDMTWEIAKEAIDYGIEHSGDRLAVTFYGGEPLLQYNLLKQCVDYVKQAKGNKNIVHSMTTNMVLMTKEIAEYIASVDSFTVVCSMDGPKEVHDENRITVDGNGSFDKAIQGLRNLVEAYKDRAATYLSLSMVMTLPATQEKLEKIQRFFESLEWLPNNITKNISYVSSSSHRSERLFKKSKNPSMNMISQYTNPLMDWAKDNTVFSNTINVSKIFTSSFTQSSHLRVHKRMIVEEPVGCYSMNGCCIPASRRLYITATGNFALCEKIGNAPYIGNVKNGINLNAIKKHYIDDYMKDAKQCCADCWAIRFCGNCYVDSYTSDGFRSEYKRDLCGSALFGAEKALVDYHEVLERYPERLEYLNDIVMS